MMASKKERRVLPWNAVYFAVKLVGAVNIE